MNIGIIGVGNIGMRYVQGITAEFPQARLYLVDSEARLKELGELGLANTTLCLSLADIPVSVDLFVIATSCEPRLSLYKQCIAREPRHIILEKYLFKGRDEFEECKRLPKSSTFVNQWMYGSRTFDCLFETEAKSVEVRGSGWGLSCNAVHWMDVMKRHLNISALAVGSDTQVTEVFPSKRKGYEELHGQFEFVDQGSDKSFKLVDKPELNLNGRMEIVVDSKQVEFDYAKIIHDGKVLSHFPFFSSQIGGIVGELLSQDRCHLPNLAESISQHLLVEDILDELDYRPAIT